MNFRLRRLAAMIALACAVSGQAMAQQSAATDSNTTRNLINLLVQNGVLTEAQAEALLQQAAREAAQAAEPVLQEGDVRVPYIPENVREDITEDVREQVVSQAIAENWAQPNTFPEWVSRIRLDADVRVRSESRFFDDYNDQYLIDFHRFNEEGPQDISQQALATGAWPPFYNTREDRINLLRLRARFGFSADISEHWRAGLRVATGSDDNPVSTNQTLGGGLEKKDLWLDRGFISWLPTQRLAFTAGRFANPFITTDMLYASDLNFDGIAATYAAAADGGMSLFGTLGAFPLEFTSDDSPSRSEFKTKNQDKWLFGAQLGSLWKMDNDNQLRAAAGYYHFDNISGERSAPCQPWFSDREAGYGCNTDWSRPAFMQKGNTLFVLRDITLDPLNPAATPLEQYVGLASEFQLVDVNLSWQAALFNDMTLRVAGHYVHNLAYDEDDMLKRSGSAQQGTTDGRVINNLDQQGNIRSGGDAWMLDLTLGTAVDIRDAGQWNLQLGYRHIEPDALPDAYNDATFHRGGTNAKGYYLGGAYGFHKRVYGQMRWMSSEEVYGAPLRVDILQLEVNARF
jgi:hypothetical protein